MTNYKPMRRASAATARWIFSYADMVTILLVLFVAIAAKDLRKLAPPPPPPAPAPAAPPPAPPAAKLPEDLLRTKRALEERGLDPRLEPRGLVVSLPQTVLFASGDDRVSAGALPLVEKIAEAIRGIPNKVTLIGHADSVPIHNRRFPDNWTLSVSRGLRLLEVLDKRYGVAASRLSVAGFGSWSPRQPNDTAENRAANRRVEIVILREAAP
jgi:chemotaxis protein MotB